MKLEIINIIIIRKMSIDNCIGSKGSHYDISLYISERLKGVDIKGNLEKNPNYLKNYIKSVIVNDFIERSLYYSSLEESDDEIKSIKLLEIADKLKNEKFLKDILKEMRQFYL